MNVSKLRKAILKFEKGGYRPRSIVLSFNEYEELRHELIDICTQPTSVDSQTDAIVFLGVKVVHEHQVLKP